MLSETRGNNAFSTEAGDGAERLMGQAGGDCRCCQDVVHQPAVDIRQHATREPLNRWVNPNGERGARCMEDPQCAVNRGRFAVTTIAVGAHQHWKTPHLRQSRQASVVERERPAK